MPSIVYDVLRSPGRPLDAHARSHMESRLGHAFSHVRIHTDAKAAESARAVNALAYTVGRDVVFDTGQYAPDSPTGRRLLAHELMHVLQQAREASSRPPDGLAVGSQGDAAEREAEHAPAMAAGHRQSTGVTASCPVLRRTDGPGTGPSLSGECEGERDVTGDFRTFVADVPALLAAVPGIDGAERARIVSLADRVLHSEGAADIDHFKVVACSSINLPLAFPWESMRAFVDASGSRLGLSEDVIREMDEFRRDPTLEGLQPILTTIAHEKRHVTIGGAAGVLPGGLRPEFPATETAQATYRVEEILTTAEEIAVSRKLLGERYRVPLSEQTQLQRLWNIARSRVTDAEANRLRGVIINQLRDRYGFADRCDNSLTVGVVSAMETGRWHFCDTGTWRVPHPLPAGLNICETDGRHRICPPPRVLETVAP